MIKFYTIAVWKHTFVAALSSSPVRVPGPRPAPAIPTVLVHVLLQVVLAGAWPARAKKRSGHDARPYGRGQDTIFPATDAGKVDGQQCP